MNDFIKKHLLPSERSSNLSWMKRSMLVERLSDEQIDVLEADLEQFPHDLEKRCRLIVSYSRDKYAKKREAANFLRHVEWMIAHHPDHEILGTPFSHVDESSHPEVYAQMTELWEKQVAEHCFDLTVAKNAANFLFHGNKELAEQYFLHALNLDSLDANLRLSIANFYHLWEGHDVEAYLMLESALRTQNLFDLILVKSKMPAMAFSAGRYKEAKKAALFVTRISAILPGKLKPFGNASDAHTIIGRIALKQGDIKAAKKELKKSMVPFGSHMSEHFGFSLDLARELAEIGEKEAVLSYLDRRDYVRGVDKWAFELRFRLLHNRLADEEDGDLLEMTDEFDVSYHNHQIAALQKLEGKVREKRLARAIDSTKSAISIYGRDDQPHSSSCNHDHGLRLARHIELLEKLEALQK